MKISCLTKSLVIHILYVFFIGTSPWFVNVAGMAATIHGEQDVSSDIVAIVNGQEITREELGDLLIEMYGEEALDVLIRRTLIYQEAKKKGVGVTGTEVKQMVKELVNNEIESLMRVNRIEDRASLEKELAKMGTTIAQLEEKLSKKLERQAEVELLARKILEKTITVTEEDLHMAYEQEYGAKIEASQIVLRTRREAEEALEKIKSGADFETMAKNASIDRASAARGGKMQPFSPDSILGKEVAHLKVGEVSDIIKTDYGYHILKITDKKTASNKSFKSVRDDLERAIKNKYYGERLRTWLVTLIEKASIVKSLTGN